MGLFSRKEPVVGHIWVKKGKAEGRLIRDTGIARLIEDWQRFVCAECGKEIEVKAGWESAVYSGSCSPLGPYWREYGPRWVAKDSDSGVE